MYILIAPKHISLFYRENFSPAPENIVGRFLSFYAIMDLVKKNLGVAVISYRTALFDADDSIDIIPLDPYVPFDLCLAYLNDRTQSEADRQFIRYTRKNFASEAIPLFQKTIPKTRTWRKIMNNAEPTPADQIRQSKYRNLIFLIIVLVGFTIYSFVTDPGSIQINIEDSTLTLSGIEEYSLSISLDDIQEVTYKEDLDRGSLIDGLEGKDFSWGTWQSDSLGIYQLYVYTDVDSGVLIRTADEVYALNFENDDLTLSFYQAFLELLSEN